METLFIVTGANGHLGSTLTRQLIRQGRQVRGLILPSEEGLFGDVVRYIKGDVRDMDSMRPLFQDIRDRQVYVIHTAGIVDISEKAAPALYDVNITGTENVVHLCEEYGVSRLVYVSTVHAIPEKDGLSVITEVGAFSPDAVSGAYAKTKAEATQIVLDAAVRGLDAVVVHPSGILGPNDPTGNHLVQLITNYIRGLLPACVNGGYDFVDVRDVAAGCILAAEKGQKGQCYILSNRHYEIKDLLRMARLSGGGRRLPTLPMWMARAAAPLMQWYARRKKQRPLYTKYSLYTLTCNDRFSHDKATSQLGYRPRDIFETVRDTAEWYKKSVS